MLVYPNHVNNKTEDKYHKKRSNSRQGHWLSRGSDFNINKENRGTCWTFEKAQKRQSLKTRTSSHGSRQTDSHELFEEEEHQAL